nr:hypothetical protein [Sterolibacterium sp.]
MTTSAMRCWRRCSLLLFLAGCQAEPPPDTAEHFRAELHGVPVHLALDDCEVLFGDRHIARGVTPEKGRKMAVSTAGRLADKRDELAELLPQLPT